MASQPPRPSVNTAFVLSGCGSLGAIQVGMLRGLLEWGEAPSFLVGSSAGALNAAIFAGNPSLGGVHRLADLWRSVRRRDLFPVQLGSLVAGLFGRSGYLVSSKGLRSIIERNVGFRNLEQAMAPIHIVATEVTSGKEVVLSLGSAVDAVLASTAIPGVCPAVRMAGHTLVDGGLARSAPISVAVALGAKRVIVLPAGFSCARRSAGDGVVPRAMDAISMMVAARLVRDGEHWIDSHIELRMAPPPCPISTSPYDFTAADELMIRALESTRIWLHNGGLEIGEIPRNLYPHEHHPDLLP